MCTSGKTLLDIWTHSICAKLLCKPVGAGLDMPGRENIEEAFEAVDKLFTVLLPLNAANMPHGDAFPVKVYFMYAVYLGYQEKVRDILKMAVKQSNQDWVRELLDVPAFYETLAATDNPPVKLDDAEVKGAEEMISIALTSRAEQGRKFPLQDIPIAELLRRSSEAAFFVHHEEYLENGIEESQKVLCPPLTEDDIAEVEQTLGAPLPPDLKEMVLIADGFHGGCYFAGGGWAGIKRSWKGSAEDYERFLGYFPEPEVRTETKTKEDESTYTMQVQVYSVTADGSGNRWGDVWVTDGAVECDDLEHVLCPPPTWKKLQEAKGKSVKEGGYSHVYFANWTGGGDEIYPSVRALIGELTLELEADVAIGRREVKDE